MDMSTSFLLIIILLILEYCQYSQILNEKTWYKTVSGVI